MLSRTKYGFFVAVSGLVLCLASMASAEAPICLIKGGNTSAPTGTHCTSEKTAYNGTKTLIKYEDGCSAPKAVDIMFQQEPGSASAVGGFQAALTYSASEMSNPTCTLDPEGFFKDEAGLECPGTYQGTTPYVFGGKANISGDLWPAGNPNFILMRVSFGAFSIAEGATGTVSHFTSSGAKMPKVLDPGSSEIQTGRIDADVICTAPPFFVKQPTGITLTQKNVNCGGDPISGTCDIEVKVTVPAMASGCENGTGSTVSCSTALPDGPGCTARTVTVTRTAPSAAAVGTADCGSGTTCTITDSGLAISSTPTAFNYSAVANCTGGAALAKSAFAGTATSFACGEVPQITASVSTTSPLQGLPITITGTVTDGDTAKDGASALPSSVTVYYVTGSGAVKTVTAAVTVTGNTGTFSVQIPGTDVIEKTDIFWGVGTTDKTMGIEVFSPATFDKTNPAATGTKIDGSTIKVGTALEFAPGWLPYPNQMPFRAGGNQRLVIGFKINEIAAVTMRIYTTDGTLIRQIENSSTDPETANNVCNWERGCSWDGTTYTGKQLASNGLYIINIYAIGTGSNFANQTINYTKGIVVMK